MSPLREFIDLLLGFVPAEQDRRLLLVLLVLAGLACLGLALVFAVKALQGDDQAVVPSALFGAFAVIGLAIIRRVVRSR